MSTYRDRRCGVSSVLKPDFTMGEEGFQVIQVAGRGRNSAEVRFLASGLLVREQERDGMVA